MKIKKRLFLDKEEIKRVKEIAREMKWNLNPEEAYIELDTGGQFDYLPPESQEPLKEGLEIFLYEFANLLLSSISFDFSAIKRPKSKILRGLRVIGTGLEEIRKNLNILFISEESERERIN